MVTDCPDFTCGQRLAVEGVRLRGARMSHWDGVPLPGAAA